jgi:hypothetical protein
MSYESGGDLNGFSPRASNDWLGGKSLWRAKMQRSPVPCSSFHKGVSLRELSVDAPFHCNDSSVMVDLASERITPPSWDLLRITESTRTGSPNLHTHLRRSLTTINLPVLAFFYPPADTQAMTLFHEITIMYLLSEDYRRGARPKALVVISLFSLA